MIMINTPSILESQVDYKRIYDSIIMTSKLRDASALTGYYEKHHIIPRCLGGGDEADNLVLLTSREHFICHYLLTRVYKKGTNEWYRMTHAFMPMKSTPLNSNGIRYVNSRLYESKKKTFSIVMSETQRGSANSQYGTMWMCNRMSGLSIKVPKSDVDMWLSSGWETGRMVTRTRKLKIKTCSFCGQPTCKRSEVCRHKGLILNTFTQFFGFDESMAGTEYAYDEYDRVKKILHDDYYVHKLSTLDIAEKYKLTSVTRLEYTFKMLGFKARSLSDALINYCNKNR